MRRHSEAAKTQTVERKACTRRASVEYLLRSSQLLLTLVWIEVRERQSDQNHAPDDIARGAVEQVVKRIGDRQVPAAEDCHRKRSHVGDRMLEAEVHEDEYH